MSNRNKKKLVINAFLMAVWRRRPRTDPIFHSDRGSQCCCNDFQKVLKNHAMISSISPKRDSWDNGVALSFLGRLKIERVFGSVYKRREDARRDTVDYIEMFYNSKRLTA